MVGFQNMLFIIFNRFPTLQKKNQEEKRGSQFDYVCHPSSSYFKKYFLSNHKYSNHNFSNYILLAYLL